MSASTAPTRSTRRRVLLRRRVIGAGVALAAGAGLLCAGSSGPAVADATTVPGSALAKSAAVTNGSGVTLTQASSSGPLGTLTSVLSTALVGAVANLPNTVTSNAATALTTTAGLQAQNATVRQPRPTPVTNYPACGQGGWDSSNCFAAIGSTTTPTLAQGALLAVSAGSVQGYATGDDQGFIGAAGTSHPLLAVPGLVFDLGVAASNAQCSTTTCTPAHSFSGGTVTPTGGTAQSFTLASGTALATVGATSLSNGGSATLVPNTVTVTANGNFLTFSVSIPLTTFLTDIGTSLTALSNGLGATLTGVGSTVALTVSVGPGDISATGNSQASAWGLEVGVNLVADIKLTVPAVLGISAGSTELVTSGAGNYPSTSGSAPNLLDLKFAYSQGTAGALLPDFVPPALI